MEWCTVLISFSTFIKTQLYTNINDVKTLQIKHLRDFVKRKFSRRLHTAKHTNQFIALKCIYNVIIFFRVISNDCYEDFFHSYKTFFVVTRFPLVWFRELNIDFNDDIILMWYIATTTFLEDKKNYYRIMGVIFGICFCCETNPNK